MNIKEHKNWKMTMGATCKADGVAFKVWAPKASSVDVKAVSKVFPLTSVGKGFYEGFVQNLNHAADYTYLLNGDIERPDPVSRFQPYGVHQASRVVDPLEFIWTDENWKGIPLKNYIIYEIHVGTFTPQGTFEGVINKLAYLKELGVTAIELMPSVEFPGCRNWGYDGTHPYAPHSYYGGPCSLKMLINACHEMGLAVVMDVVYNHLGPEGNYFNDFGYYFTDRYKTSWGKSINFDGEYSDYVRQYFIDNALYWLTEYHVDALRLVAIHSIYDISPNHIVKQLTTRFREEAQLLKRKAYIIAESDLNDVRVINPLEIGGYNCDSVMNDDFHHALHAVLTGNKNSYLADFGKVKDMQKAIQEGFVYDGRWSEYRKKKFGSSSAKRPGDQFVVYLQDHDQITNACGGERLSSIIGLEKFKLATMLLLFAPNIPLIFMGQEWGAKTPFYYFTTHHDEPLIENIHSAYKHEHINRGTEVSSHDPQDEQTFWDSKLNWSELGSEVHFSLLDFHKKLIHLRKTFPSLANCSKDFTKTAVKDDVLIMYRKDTSGDTTLLVCNLTDNEKQFSLKLPAGQWKFLIDSRETRNVETSLKGGEEKIIMTIPRWSGILYGREVK